MEGLKELVAASFARYGIECPEGDCQVVGPNLGQRIVNQPIVNQMIVDQTTVDQTIAAQFVRAAEPTLTGALPEHNFRKSLQDDPAP